MQIIKLLYLTLAAGMVAAVPAFAQQPGLEAITPERSMAHMRYLSSDELEGRRTGSEGNHAAARYIRDEALRLGLTPLPGEEELFHPLQYIRVTTVPEKSSVTLRDTMNNIAGSAALTPLLPPADSVRVDGELLFAGYGYVNSGEQYNDFAGVSAREKIVMIMTRTPAPEGTRRPAPGSAIDPVTEVRKVPMILLQQAKAILYVADPDLGHDISADLLAMGSAYSLIPLFRKQLYTFSPNIYAVTTETANRMLSCSGVTLSQLQDSIASLGRPVSFTVPSVNLLITAGVEKDTVTSNNIIGYIEGSDPALKDEAVMFIAHYDHLGTDVSGNIYNGANDNASGSVGLLNIASAFAALGVKPARSAIFFWSTGEEEGLHGSSHYTANPLFPLKKTVAVLNFDMIGRSRLESDTTISISGKPDITGHDTIRVVHDKGSPWLLSLAAGACYETGIHPVEEGKGTNFSGSDHYPFFRKNVPVLLFFTGLHSDYHRPTDRYDLIDFEKLVKVSKAGFLTGYRIASLPDPKKRRQP